MKNAITSKEACTLAHKIRRETGCSLADAFKAAYAGTNTVANKTHWTADELNQIFSDKTAELLRKGYTIDLAGMAGHQGEVGKIIFRKNDAFYALVMEKKNSFNDGKYNDHFVIWFGKYTEEVKMNCLDTWNTLWLNKFEASWKQVFVKISDNFFVTEAEAKAANEKWSSRVLNQYPKPEIIDSKYYKHILPVIRAQKGCKSLRVSNILEVKRVYITSWRTNEVTGHYYKVVTDKTDKTGKPVVLDIRFKSNNK